MRFHNLLVNGAALGATSAFLVNPVAPATVNSAQLQSLTAHPYPTTYKLDCSTCPLALNTMRNGKLEWTNGVKNDLLLEFQVKDNSVFLNGLPMLDANANNLMVPQKVKQVIKEGELDNARVSWQPFDGELGLSYSTHQTRPKIFKTKEGITTLYEVDFQVLSIAEENVNTDDVLIKLIKDPAGKIAIHSLSRQDPMLSPPTATCSSIMCRLVSAINAKMAAARTKLISGASKLRGSCRKGHKGAYTGPILKGGLPKFAGKFPPEGHHQPKADHHSAFSRMAHRFAHMILIPVLFGIAAGATASAVGLLVGQVVVFIWMRYRGGRKGAYQHVEEGEDTDEDEEVLDKEGLPKYDDVEVVVVDEKKELL